MYRRDVRSLMAVRIMFTVQSKSKQNDRWCQCVWPWCWQLRLGLVPQDMGWRCVPARRIDTTIFWPKSKPLNIRIRFVFSRIFDLGEISYSSHPYNIANSIQKRKTLNATSTHLKWCFYQLKTRDLIHHIFTEEHTSMSPSGCMPGGPS